jgi:hypothetical protein
VSLPIEWVEKIFKKLSVTYGRDFLGRYEGIPLNDVKSDWAHELSGFEVHPESIKHALQNLSPSKAPTVYEFRNVCSAAPKMAMLELLRPPQDPSIVAAIVSGIKSKPVMNGMKDWAYRLKARHEAGEKLNLNQVRCYTEALGIDLKAA